MKIELCALCDEGMVAPPKLLSEAGEAKEIQVSDDIILLEMVLLEIRKISCFDLIVGDRMSVCWQDGERKFERNLDFLSAEETPDNLMTSR